MASNNQPKSSEGNRRVPKRYITDHNSEGLSVFNTTIPEALDTPQAVMGPLSFHLGYATTTTPVDMNDQADLKTYSAFLNPTSSSSPPGIYLPGGSVVRIVEMQATSTGTASGDEKHMETPMHRTTSLDYGVVLDGRAELVLDSGESRILERGDLVVQRGTNHLWRNASSSSDSREPCRMLFITLEAKPVVVGGKPLVEETAGL